MEYIKQINQAVAFIESNLKKNIDLKEIANHASYSSYHFHRLFHVIIGEPPGNYIRKRRLSQAAIDLISTG